VTEQRQAEQAGQPLVQPNLCPRDRMRDPLTGRWLGHVKWYSSEKGYGFLIRGDGEEVFFHRSGVLPPGPAHLMEGTPVTFDVEEATGSKPKAVEVALANPPLAGDEETSDEDAYEAPFEEDDGEEEGYDDEEEEDDTDY
jgi:CspA family cold shock protein